MIQLLIYFMTILTTQVPNPLSPWKWKNRLLIIHENKSLYDNLLKRAEGVRDRDMIILHLNSNELISFPVNIDVNVNKITGYHKIIPGKSEAILIGKDGGIKLRTPSPDVEKIFTLIDGMPMRQYEMKKKGN